MIRIYKITNTINEKVYIGKTSRKLTTRWREHVSRRNSRGNKPLYKAFNKYGHTNFTISEIEICHEDISNEREIYWIKHYDSYGRSGYNATIGGDGGATSGGKPCWIAGKEFKSLTEAGEHFNVNRCSVAKWIKKGTHNAKFIQ